MSLVVGAMGGGQAEAAWIDRGSGFIKGKPKHVRVPARTLTSVLKEAEVERVDLLILDVEGYEVPVLEGLDFEHFAPRSIVAEDQYDDKVKEYLVKRGYSLVARLSERRYTRDRLYMRP
jgi:hypothetical protein